MNKGLIGNQVFHFHKCEPECQIDWQVHSIRKGKENKEQEEKSLLNVNDSFRKTIIVRSNIKKWKDDKRILFLSLKEFLINPDSIKT